MNRTPTNELITQSVELYVSVLAMVLVPVTVGYVFGDSNRPAVVVGDDVWASIGHAVIFYGDDVIEPLKSAHAAMCELQMVTLDHASITHEEGSPTAMINRRAIKRIRATLARADVDMRRAMARLFV